MTVKKGDAIILTGYESSYMPADLVGFIFIIVENNADIVGRCRCRGLFRNMMGHNLWYIHPGEMKKVEE